MRQLPLTPVIRRRGNAGQVAAPTASYNKGEINVRQDAHANIIVIGAHQQKDLLCRNCVLGQQTTLCPMVS